ncbi:hypothetical protein BDK51DRAFT_40577 [Blyttiomyces helicus]|uniref:Pyrrolo-quinoline quinone repeat domain-containing protein n=1 Tax=Blyttiomyces helicus TaxID=388810 RepID=A0A4P9WC97_9FUNG|nr:hypothetical protein BDK51DRAFT_40577 [Blyttiomyces helicus]|eukprot:RKO89265.1 hypothetical protein BDK51DRAFT_40577 [Blyttiomyces helicus]
MLSQDNSDELPPYSLTDDNQPPPAFPSSSTTASAPPVFAFFDTPSLVHPPSHTTATAPPLPRPSPPRTTPTAPPFPHPTTPATPSHHDLLFLATGGTVHAVSKLRGATVWSHTLGTVTPLGRASSYQGLCSLLPSTDGTSLFCGFAGELVVLDSMLGAVKTSRKMHSDRLDISLAYVPGGAAATASTRAERDIEATMGVFTYVGSGTCIRAVDSETGVTVWTCYLAIPVGDDPLGLDRIAAAPSLLYEDGILYCAALGCVMAVDAMTGVQVWWRSFLLPRDTGRVRKRAFQYHEVTLATCATSNGFNYHEGQGRDARYGVSKRAERTFVAGTSGRTFVINELGEEYQKHRKYLPQVEFSVQDGALNVRGTWNARLMHINPVQSSNSHVCVSPAGGNLVFAACNEFLHLISTRTSKIVWSSQLATNNIQQLTVLRPIIPDAASESPLSLPPSPDDILIVLLSNITLHAVSPSDPTRDLWTVAFSSHSNASIHTDLAVLNSHILVTSIGKVRAFDMRGNKLWTRKFYVHGSNPVTLAVPLAGQGAAPGHGWNRSAPIALSLPWKRVREFAVEEEVAELWARSGMRSGAGEREHTLTIPGPSESPPCSLCPKSSADNIDGLAPPYSLTDDTPPHPASPSFPFSSTTPSAPPAFAFFDPLSLDPSAPSTRPTAPPLLPPYRSRTTTTPLFPPSTSAPPGPHSLLFLATGGTVHAVSNLTGASVWSRTLGPLVPLGRASSNQGLCSLLPSTDGILLGVTVWTCYLAIPVGNDALGQDMIAAAPSLLYEDGILYCAALGYHEVTLATCATNNGFLYNDGEGRHFYYGESKSGYRTFVAETGGWTFVIDEHGEDIRKHRKYLPQLPVGWGSDEAEFRFANCERGLKLDDGPVELCGDPVCDVGGHYEGSLRREAAGSRPVADLIALGQAWRGRGGTRARCLRLNPQNQRHKNHSHFFPVSKPHLLAPTA